MCIRDRGNIAGSLFQGGALLGFTYTGMGAGLMQQEAQISAQDDTSRLKDYGMRVGMGQFGSQAGSQLAELSAGRMEQAANFMAEDSAVDFMDRGFNMQSSEFFGAIGGSPGALGAGPRPTSMVGQAYTGGLGAGAMQSARAAGAGGSMRSQVGSASTGGGFMGGLGRQWAGSYGRDAMYHDYSMGEVLDASTSPSKNGSLDWAYGFLGKQSSHNSGGNF